jgi:hypothetical protein
VWNVLAVRQKRPGGQFPNLELVANMDPYTSISYANRCPPLLNANSGITI